MNALENNKKANNLLGVEVNDDLKALFGPSPLFSEKNEKAAKIMTLVREKQRKDKI